MLHPALFDAIFRPFFGKKMDFFPIVKYNKG